MNKAAHHRDLPAVPAENGDAAEGPSAGATARNTLGDTADSNTADSDTTERWTVDGIEDSPRGPLARLEREDGTTFDLPLSVLPESVREGDLLAVRDGPDGVVVRILMAGTLERRRAMQTQLEALNSAANKLPGDLQDENGEITV